MSKTVEMHLFIHIPKNTGYMALKDKFKSNDRMKYLGFIPTIYPADGLLGFNVGHPEVSCEFDDHVEELRQWCLTEAEAVLQGYWIDDEFDVRTRREPKGDTVDSEPVGWLLGYNVEAIRNIREYAKLTFGTPGSSDIL